jgi:hypothetical protein
VHFARAILLARLKGDCDGAANELRRYEQLAGPELSSDSGAALRRECERSRTSSRAISAATAPTDDAPTSPATARGEDTRPAPVPTAGAPAASAGP